MVPHHIQDGISVVILHPRAIKTEEDFTSIPPGSVEWAFQVWKMQTKIGNQDNYKMAWKQQVLKSFPTQEILGKCQPSWSDNMVSPDTQKCYYVSGIDDSLVVRGFQTDEHLNIVVNHVKVHPQPKSLLILGNAV